MLLHAVVADTGRVGKVVRQDPTDDQLMYKLKFLDGAEPAADWFAKHEVELLTEQRESTNVEGALRVAMPLARATEEELATQDCSICLGPFQEPCQAPCGHVYCRGCLHRALAVGPPSWCGACPLCRRVTSLCEVRDLRSGVELASAAVTSLFGTVFVQRYGLGCASYHFEGEDVCYISYANVPASCKLDNGCRPPTKKYFEKQSWDPDTRTFRGTITWDPKFNGESKWDYELVFAADYFGVVAGHVVVDGGQERIAFRPPWEDEAGGLNYLRWTPPPTTVFGSVFVQGFFYHAALEGIASYHFCTRDHCYISYASAPSQWGGLDDGSALPERKVFCAHEYDASARTFRGMVEWEPTLKGAACWEYQMVFAEDFSRIVGGFFRSFRPDGTFMGEKDFVDPEVTVANQWNVHGMRYVRKPGVLMAAPAM